MEEWGGLRSAQSNRRPIEEQKIRHHPIIDRPYFNHHTPIILPLSPSLTYFTVVCCFGLMVYLFYSLAFSLLLLFTFLLLFSLSSLSRSSLNFSSISPFSSVRLSRIESKFISLHCGEPISNDYTAIMHDTIKSNGQGNKENIDIHSTS